MTDSPAAFLASLLVLAGLCPVIAARWPLRLFEVLPPIVLSYGLATALAVLGVWGTGAAVEATQRQVMTQALPALMFLLLVRCDLRAILALGPRVLLAFGCATATIATGFIVAALLFRGVLPDDAWKPLAAVAGGWVGGTANLVAVSQAIDTPPELLSFALLTDALCYSVWVLVLFATVPLAPRFNAWVKARGSAETVAGFLPEPEAATAPGHVLMWLGLSLAVGAGARELAALLPQGGVVNATTWTLLAVSVAGVLVALTPLRRLPGAEGCGSALLALVVVTLASQGSFEGLAAAPWFVLAGFTVLAVHAALMAGAARLFRLDLALCGVASLANIGGVASAPLLAAMHARALAPLGVLLALLGYLLGTGVGLALASVMPALMEH
ncbi:DUF819 family protein [Silanimonas sp.]|uniref:DUF819 family protein n=1 Tax=Silanimonas sp. TaxID=1929290 RepID=UPI0022BB2B33|nr:DUF819 family protein [Silanimonas sp.]MCZ8165725.1 DUF819 family protein [Silanimonas sp.]